MNSEASNIVGFNSLVKSIHQLPPKCINLRSIFLGLWNFVIFELFAAVHTWLSLYSSGCHAQYSWTNVSTTQINARLLSTPWRCNIKIFFCETAEIFIPLIFVKTHIEETVFIIIFPSKVSCICAVLPFMLHVRAVSCLVVWFSWYTWKIQIVKIIIKIFHFPNTYCPSLRSTRIELHQLRTS